jgi:hypothetical protein
MASNEFNKSPGTCPRCHQPLKPGVKFCEACGAKIELAPVCTSCGAPITPGVKFCETCGKPVALQPPVQVPAPIPLEKMEYPAQPVEPKLEHVPVTPPAEPPFMATKPSPVTEPRPETVPRHVTQSSAGASLPQKNLIIAGVVGIVILAAIVFFVVLPLLSGAGSTPVASGAGEVKAGGTLTATSSGSSGVPSSASSSTSGTQNSQAASFNVQPTSIMPANYQVTFQAERDGITGLVTVTFAGGPGMNGIRDTSITLTKSDGTVETKSWKPKRNGDSTTVQGTLKTDHLEAIANFYNGEHYRVMDQIFEYKKKN